MHIKLLLLLLFCGSVTVKAQSTAPFTVLSNNTDTANRKLYVEIMYEGSGCTDYQARFRMGDKNGLGGFVKVDSFLNNQGTFDNVGDSILQRPMAGGYKLRFNLPAGVSRDDSVYICVVTEMLPYRCIGCGAGGSSPLFTTLDVIEGCPYTGDDILACHPRKGSNGTLWEAWIQDSRDCQPYRIVQMPDGRWWFAQNLNFQENLSYRTLRSGDVTEAGGVGEFWCPSGLSAETGSPVSAIASSENRSTDNSEVGATSCKTYGALYSWTTAMAINGRTKAGDSDAVPIGQSSKHQGICPDGWLLPSDYDFGVLFNAVEGCFPPTQMSAMAPCNHLSDDVTVGYFGSTKAAAAVKNTQSCRSHSAAVDTFCATYSNPAWAWRRQSYDGKMNTPYALGQDSYGFGLYPSGIRYYDGTMYTGFGHRWLLWTSSQYNATNAWYRHAYYTTTIGRNYSIKGHGFNVRCVRDGVAIVAPGNIIQSAASLALTVFPKIEDVTYTWSVQSSAIANIESKITFPNGNGTSSAHDIIASLNLGVDDMNKNFILLLNVNDGLKERVYKKEITVDCLTEPTSIIGADSAICLGNQVTLGLEGGTIPSSGVAWVWREGSVDGTEVGRGTSVSVSPVKATVYYVKAEGACTSKSLSKEVRVANPVQPFAYPTVYACPNNTAIELSQYLVEPSELGGLTPQYQWYQGSTTNTDQHTAISGATNKTYITPNNLTGTIYYHRALTICNTTVISGYILLNITYDPQNNANRYANSTICSGESVTLNPGVAVSYGNSDVSYQWQSSTNATSWTNINEYGTGVNYTTPTLTTKTYYRRLVNVCGTTYTPASYSTVTVNSSLIQDATNYEAYVCPNNSSLTLTIPVPTGCSSGTPTYQWQSSTNNSTWTNISGATGVNYTTPTGVAVNTWMYYRRQATLGGETVTSGYYRIYPHNSIQNNANRYVSATVTCGETIAMDPGLALTYANGTPTYQWQDSVSGRKWANISGATSASYTTPPMSATTHYRRLVIQCGVTYTPASYGTITVPPASPPSISGSQPSAANGTSVTLTATSNNPTDVIGWYSAATGGTLLQDGGSTYTKNAPFTVYAQVKTADGCVSGRTTGGAGSAAIPTTMVFNYTGAPQKVSLPAGTYKIEAWGARGGGAAPNSTTLGDRGGAGSYTAGTIQLTQETELGVYVGGMGAIASPYRYTSGGFNGGGNGASTGYGGGGASDVRIGSELVGRIMVAAGGGGADNAGVAFGANDDGSGGNAGGLIGENAYINGAQVKGTATTVMTSTAINGGGKGFGGSQTGGYRFGLGEDLVLLTDCGGGGGGYYGGLTTSNNQGGAGGGSSFISGHAGCNAVNISGAHTGQANHYSNMIFTSTIMIDGSGYRWTTSRGAHMAMPNPAGGNYAVGLGHAGDGVVKITKQ